MKHFSEKLSMNYWEHITVTPWLLPLLWWHLDRFGISDKWFYGLLLIIF